MSGANVPRLEWRGEAVYFVDSRGDRFRLYDTSYGPPYAKRYHTAIHPFGSADATHRTFVPRDPTALRPQYRFQPDDDRELTAELVADQMHRCTWTSRKKFDSSRWGVP